jgi:hydrogenase maturation protease
MNNRTLVLGVGNYILGDDGIGIHAVRELSKQTDLADYEEAPVSSLELVEMFRGYEKVIIVDAIMTRDGIPGKIYELCGEDIPTLHGLSAHDVDFRTALEYGTRFMGKMPEIKIYGIEAENVTDFCETLTPVVEESLRIVIDKIKSELKENGST